MIKHNGRTIRKNLIGNIYARLLVVSISDKVVKNETYYNCICDCGKEKEVAAGDLTEGNTKSCGCLNIERVKETHSKPRGESAKYGAYGRYKDEKRRNCKFNLSFDEAVFIFEQNCYYCNKSPSNVFKSKHDNGDYSYSGIDRVDNSKDYEVENVVPCCKECNFIKGQLSYTEFIQMVKDIYEYQHRDCTS